VERTPRSAIVGILLQFLSLGLGILAAIVFPHVPGFLRGGRGDRRCDGMAHDLHEFFTKECQPGDHRAMALAAAIALVAVILYFVGRNLAKRAGID
jgi:hypothetical protein